VILSHSAEVWLWDSAEPGADPVGLDDESLVEAVAVLPDGRVVTCHHRVPGDWLNYGWLLLWDPAEPGTAPVELGRHKSRLTAVTALPDGRVVTGSIDRKILLWDARSTSPGISLACSVHALATSLSLPGTRLFIGHGAEGMSCWVIHAAQQNAPELQST
jgi:WD40 repeat protein